MDIRYSLGFIAAVQDLGQICPRYVSKLLEICYCSQETVLYVLCERILKFSEGYLTSCTFDYLTNTFDTKLFVACIFVCSYVFPMSLIIYFYSGIVKQVFAHEAALR